MIDDDDEDLPKKPLVDSLLDFFGADEEEPDPKERSKPVQGLMDFLDSSNEVIDTVNYGKDAAEDSVMGVADVHAHARLLGEDIGDAARLVKKSQRVYGKLTSPEHQRPKSTARAVIDWGRIIFGDDPDER